ncbi:MAG: hypothetical protein Q4G25_12395 [Paracoccus sp. (in: a-proteobacteria)]|nr:hypothetical protein [Paracoccus sp. (in: a-proteobacteria)]
MRNGLQRLLDNAPVILVIAALVVFLGNMAVITSRGGFGDHSLPGLVSGIISGAFAPVSLIGLAAIAHYLDPTRKG